MIANRLSTASRVAQLATRTGNVRSSIAARSIRSYSVSNAKSNRQWSNAKTFGCSNSLTFNHIPKSYGSKALNMIGQHRFASDLPEHIVIAMPALSPTMTSGNFGQWKVKIGDKINPGDVIADVETDKAQMDFECQEEGYVAKIFLKGGDKDVSVGTPLCILAENKEDLDAFKDMATPKPDPDSPAGQAGGSSQATPEPEAKPEPKSETKAESKPTKAAGKQSNDNDRIFASPVAKSLASEKGIDLGSIVGTGPNGRIVKSDVENYKPQKASAGQTVSSKSTPAPTTVGASKSAAFVDIPLTNMRKVIAQRLQESKSQLPHYYLTMELDATKILKLREVLNAEANGTYKLSVNDFVVKASSKALLDVPAVNSSWQDSFIRQFNTADIAVAVATESGLITPIVRSAENKGLASISGNIRELASKARSGKLTPEEYQGGTFTISNLGMYGISDFTAIINPPNACILAVGTLEDKLVLDSASEKGFKQIKVMKVTLSCDHRVVDGAVGSQWLGKFKEYFENPLKLLL